MSPRPASNDVIPGVAALSVGHPGTVPPDGWQWIRLTDVARLESGHTPSRKHPEYWNGDVPWVSLPDARRHHGGVIHDTTQKTNDKGLANSAARLLPAETVCLSRTASVGYVFRLGRPMATSQDFVNWVCSEALDPRFLMYALMAEGDHLLNFGKGTTHTTIYFPEALAFHLCLPPLAEQRRIVETVSLVLARVHAAREQLARVPGILKRFRQSVFAAACSGRLTQEWREQNAPNAGASRIVALAELLREPLRNGHSAKVSTDGHGVRTFTLTAFTYGDFCVQNTKITVANATKVKDLWVEPGDIFVERSNTPDLVGTVSMYRGPKNVAIFPDLVIRVRVDPAVVQANYLEICLRSPAARTYFKDRAQGTAGSMPKIDQSVVEEFELELPNLAEQQEITRRVEGLLATAERIERRVAAATQRSNRLTQAILVKALRGQLIPTDAERARKEGHEYEPTSALLERVLPPRPTRPEPERLRLARSPRQKAATQRIGVTG